MKIYLIIILLFLLMTSGCISNQELSCLNETATKLCQQLNMSFEYITEAKTIECNVFDRHNGYYNYEIYFTQEEKDNCK
jgi:hypothetical protein